MVQQVAFDTFGNLLSKEIKGFPYPVRFCPYCEQELSLEKACHVDARQEVFKALYLCRNKECPASDDLEGKAYARVYYSSDEAYSILATHRLPYDRNV